MEQLPETTKQEIIKLIEIALKPINGKVISIDPEIPMAQMGTYVEPKGQLFRVDLSSDQDIQVVYLIICSDEDLKTSVGSSIQLSMLQYNHITSEVKKEIEQIISNW